MNKCAAVVLNPQRQSSAFAIEDLYMSTYSNVYKDFGIDSDNSDCKIERAIKRDILAIIEPGDYPPTDEELDAIDFDELMEDYSQIIASF